LSRIESPLQRRRILRARLKAVAERGRFERLVLQKCRLIGKGRHAESTDVILAHLFTQQDVVGFFTFMDWIRAQGMIICPIFSSSVIFLSVAAAYRSRDALDAQAPLPKLRATGVLRPPTLKT